MSVTRRLTVVAATALAYWVLVLCNPMQFAIHDLMLPPQANNQYTGYTMYVRCHPAQFHIPQGLPC